ncbi:ABC transporter substrate-binding protein [Alphaproteobacteria bacterium]|nr:ABC transporter substrate-binding protein [Alphaproteobacteria bacterium]MDA8643114.1 ABC transporter substrate-binding protein [Alphaproteobacteria bacterium]MDA8780439.1 ABC transporter substrate-binding protein [Alphaproteobacteria bacterium]MDA9591052.1 ABC transporter substrate-binding protein [Alphaproteobacteria bacterium]MDB2406176.1 ABC transporter substrate-binding protein [Alphaproteobacteria bacterium]
MLLLPVQAQALEAVVFATDWKAQAEQGGFYQAKALGLYEKAGLDVTLRGGGPGVNIPQLLGAGAIDFGMGSNSFIPLNMVRAGVPAKAVMAAFQKDPQVLITHPRDDISTLADIKERPVMIADASVNAFWVWLRAKYDFSDRQIRKYTFNLAPFLVNKEAIQQGYVTSEPYTIATRGGFEPQVFLLSDYGYPSYAAMVLAQNQLIEQRPELVQAFVNASIEGWQSYVYGDPTPGNQLILAANPEMRQDIINQAIEQIRSRAMLASSDTEKNGLGAMSRARWQSFFTTMSENGVYRKSLDWQNAFTTKFVNPDGAE